MRFSKASWDFAFIYLLYPTVRTAAGSDVVFMLGLPTRLDSYVHVAGRTAREGRKGHAISLLTSSQQEERFAQYKSELGLKAEVIDLRFLS